jgi:diguanylate cyclase (GGDEF)-like protein
MLITRILERLCQKSGVSYILFNNLFEIVDFNQHSTMILEKGSDVREVFEEFIEQEKQILELVRTKKSLHLKMILKEPYCYDVEIESLESDETLFVAYITDKTNFKVSYSKTIKNLNKKILTLESKKSDSIVEYDYNNLVNENFICFHVDLNGIISDVNRVLMEYLGKDREDIVGEHFSTYFHSRERDLVDNKKIIFNAEDANNHSSCFYADVIAREEGGRVVENVIVCQDITHLKQEKKRLDYAVSHDSLTGLLNKTQLLKEIDEKIEKDGSQESIFTLCSLSLNNFQQLNEIYGRHAGDMLLKHVANLLSDFVRDDDIVARVGADRFVILYSKIKDKASLEMILERVKNLSISSPLHYNEEEVIHFSLSLGLSFYPKDARESKSLLDYAEAEMLRFKKELKDSMGK